LLERHDMKKVTVVGSLNIDHVLKVNALPLRGETLISDSYDISGGGKGANQAIAIGRLGVFVNMIGKVGGDVFGKMLIKNLIESGVRTKGVIVDKSQRTGAAFITVDRDGNNTIVVAPGANQRLTIDDIRTKESQILESDVMVLQMEIPKDTVSYVIDFSKDTDKLVILNFAPAIDIDMDVLEKVDYLVMNEIEVKYLTGIGFDFRDIDVSVRKLRKLFNKNVVITLGDKGAVLITLKNEILKIPAYEIKPIDSTGAGDAFIGGFILGLVTNKSIEDCIVIGNAAGALSVTKLGAQSSLPYKNELNDFLKSNDDKSLV